MTVPDLTALRLPRDGWASVMLGLVATVVAFARIPSRLWDGLYAEDGRVFLMQWEYQARPGLVVTPYAGYIHLIPRVLTGVVMLLPVTWWGVATTVLACMVVGGTAAGVWLAARSMELSRPLALAMASVPVLAPMAGVEALGNLANTHWYVMYLLIWICLAGARLRRPWVWAVVVAACCLTEVQSVLLLPLVAFVWWRRRFAWPLVAAWLIGTAGQLLAALTSHRERVPGHPGIPSILVGYLSNNIMGGLGFSEGEATGVLTSVPHWVVALGCAGVLAGALWAVWPSPHRWTALAMAALSWVLWAACLWSNNSTDFGFDAKYVRWSTTSSMALLAFGIFALAAAKPIWSRWAVGLVVLVLILRAFVAVLPARHGDTAPWLTSLATARTACTTESAAVVPTWPDGWQVWVPCTRLG